MNIPQVKAENEHSPEKDHEETELEQNKISKHTDKAVKVAVRVFQEYLKLHNLDTSIETITAEKLNGILRSFYLNARRQNGERFKRNSLKTLRTGLTRYFSQTRDFEIVGDPIFKEANKAYRAEWLVGDSSVEHHPPISVPDLQKLYHSFNTDIPAGLQEKVMFDILFFMYGHKGKDSLRDFTKSMLEVKMNGSGVRYVCKADEDVSHEGICRSETQGKRMYEIKGTSTFILTYL